ncbi:MAG TPA: hypothetical protein VMQ93_16245 [Novosphingobium sp.]|nr:hypothetical protein [Novosphingobium sp.]
MLAIILHTAHLDNSRTRRAAGDTIEIGEASNQITGIVAADLVDRNLASEQENLQMQELADGQARLLDEHGTAIDVPEGNLSDPPSELDLTDAQRAALPPLGDLADETPAVGKARKTKAD